MALQGRSSHARPKMAPPLQSRAAEPAAELLAKHQAMLKLLRCRGRQLSCVDGLLGAFCGEARSTLERQRIITRQAHANVAPATPGRADWQYCTRAFLVAFCIEARSSAWLSCAANACFMLSAALDSRHAQPKRVSSAVALLSLPTVSNRSACGATATVKRLFLSH